MQLGIFLFGILYNSVVWINYEINKEAITKEFCINIDRPELNCNGKCHIERQLIFSDEPISTDAPLQAPSYIPLQENFIKGNPTGYWLDRPCLVDSANIEYYDQGWKDVNLNPPFKLPAISV